MAEGVPRKGRFFTPHEANLVLPKVRTLLEQITVRKKELDKVRGELDGLLHNNHLGRYDRRRRDFETKLQRLQGLIEHLEGHGCILRDVEQGLIDFPAERFGQSVYLCWHRGDPEVQYWHGLSEGFAGRKPLKVELSRLA